jgi:competence protein ComEC
MKTLRYLNIHEISHILISHADEDHIGGMMDLLTNEDLKVRNVFLNADALRKTLAWRNVRRALADARKRNGTRVHVGLTSVQTGELNVGEVEIEILAPTPELAMSGAGGEDLHGNRLAANSMSVVVGLAHHSHRVALLPGDIDEIGLRNLLEDRDDLRADILVFPHHGGKAGTVEGEAFAQMLCSVVQPHLILFSIDRNHLVNPREEIIRGIKAVAPHAPILCTQLSRRCAAQLPDSDYSHLSDLPAAGRESRHCCGGTLVIKIDRERTKNIPFLALHKEFVESKVPTPLCLRSAAEASSPISSQGPQESDS